MDILIRNVGKDVVFNLDELAKKQGKSRNEFIKDVLNMHIQLPEIRNIDNAYEKILTTALKVIDENTQVMYELLEMRGKNE